MKTLDMLAALLADPDLVFTNEDNYTAFSNNGATSFNNGAIMWQGHLGAYPFALTAENLNANWKRKRIPVDFMTAIQSGEIIQSEYWPEGMCIDTTDVDQGWPLTKREIVGKWYVED